MPPSTGRSRHREDTALSPAKRIKHCCGHFLGELREGAMYVPCARCKELVVLAVDQSWKDPRSIKTESKVPATVT